MKSEKTTAFVNGKIFTADEEQLYADSMIVEDGKISWVGKEEKMPEGDFTKVDLQGKRVLPGFVDAHMHPVMLADMSRQISCLPPNIYSIEEMAEKIKEVREKQGPGKWVMGWGYDEGKFEEKRSPNRYDLDKGCEDSPVYIFRTCGHVCCVNSKALEIAGIDKNTEDPQGGEIDRDENGEPTGVLRENARELVIGYLPEVTSEDIIEELVELGELLQSQGVTSIAEMGNLKPEDNYVEYEAAVKKGFKQKVSMYYFWDYFKDDENFDIPQEHFSHDQQIRVGGLKLIGDGSISGRTAWVGEPYFGTDDEYGLPVCSDELIESAIEFCKEKKCQLSMHAMGEKAITRIIDRVYKEDKWNDGSEPHLRVEHVTEPSEDNMAKAIEKGIGFATQPIFMYAEIESYLKNFGTERTKKAYPVKTMLDKGVQLCFSTDAPATSWAVPSDPFPCIKSAVTRKAYDGTDCGADEKVDIETAICLYTREAAKLIGFDKTGQLKEGYDADFIVLNGDIIDIEPEKIDEICVEQTYIAGEKVYQK